MRVEFQYIRGLLKSTLATLFSGLFLWKQRHVVSENNNVKSVDSEPKQ